ncbi:MAG TPA: DUF6502 family protein [Gammaproteobacteria bacterium]
MRSPFQQAVLNSLEGILLPLAKLMLRCGVGCSEFIAVSKAAFVQAASEGYGLRGRPTNVSRVAAMTGLSRKEVSRIRAEGPVERWTPDMEVNPANTVLHYWHFDPLFCEPLGVPRPLHFDGDMSFTMLVRKYAGDIPAGAMRKELTRAGTVIEDQDGKLLVRERYFYPAAFDEDFVRNAAFSLKHLAETLVHNAQLAGDTSEEDSAIRHGRFERFAWSDHLRPDTVAEFKQWVRMEGTRFVELADNWIGQHELPHKSAPGERRAIGVGIYYFEED